MADDKKLTFSTLATSKICRLCETKDGPFLNIFGPDMDIAKKIENTVLITISENDDLPHKICFRCSAKLEDFQEFICKCVKTQENLSKLVGKKFSQKNPLTRKIKYSWEARLNENKISNEEYCDELIKKALELATGVKAEDKKILVKHNVKDSEIRLMRVDGNNFPGVQNKNGSYKITDIKKVPKAIHVSPIKSAKKKEEIPDTNKNLGKDNIEKVTPEKDNGKNDKNAIPDNFVTVKVSGVGLVYTCKHCDSVLIDIQKVHNHKCVKLRTSRPVAYIKTSVSDQQAKPTNIISFNQSPPSILRKPGPARYKISDNATSHETQAPKLGTVVIRSDNNKSVETQDSNSVNNQPVPVLPNNQIPFNPGNMQPPNVSGAPNNFFGYQFPTNLYLVPSGNNTFSLQAGPSVCGPSIPVQTSVNQITKPAVIPPLYHPRIAPKDNSILPDLSNSSERQTTNVVQESDTQNKRGSKRSKKQVEEPAPPIIPQARILQKNKQNKEVPKKAEAAPYPIGLLCRNGGASGEPNMGMPAASKSPEYPQYTILPPKTPGKIVISTVAQKKGNPTENDNNDDAKPLKKRRKQSITSREDPPPPPAPSGPEHFFTYINLDTMFSPGLVLPTNTVQVSSVSTTVTPDTPPVTSKKANIPKSKTHSSTPIVQREDLTDDKYVCEICDLSFSREKKLLAHVKTHYAPRDDDD